MRGYIDAPIIIARTQVRHPVIVVEDLSFPILIGINILCPHDTQLRVGASSSIHLDVERCSVCDEERSAATHLRSISTVVVVSEDISFQCCAAFESPFACHPQFSTTRTLSRNPYLHSRGQWLRSASFSKQDRRLYSRHVRR